MSIPKQIQSRIDKFPEMSSEIGMMPHKDSAHLTHQLDFLRWARLSIDRNRQKTPHSSKSQSIHKLSMLRGSSDNERFLSTDRRRRRSNATLKLRKVYVDRDVVIKSVRRTCDKNNGPDSSILTPNKYYPSLTFKSNNILLRSIAQHANKITAYAIQLAPWKTWIFIPDLTLKPTVTQSYNRHRKFDYVT